MSYLKYLENQDLVITTPYIKEEILKEKTLNKVLLNVKIMSLKEFKDNVVGTYNEEALIYLMRNYNLTYDVAKTKLDNIFYDVKDLKVLKDELDAHNLLIYNPNFKNKYHKIKIIGDILIDNYIQNLLKPYDVSYINPEKEPYHREVRFFNSILDEVLDTANLISEELKHTSMSHIYLVNVSTEYYSILKRIFKMFNLNVNIPVTSSLIGTKVVRDFLNILHNTKDLDAAKKVLGLDEVSKEVINIVNKYAFTKKVDDVLIEAFEKELKNKKLKPQIISNAINLISYDEVGDEGYYHILGFNETLAYTPHKDEDYLSDAEKSSLGLATSLEYNNYLKEKIKKVILSTPNLTISYKKYTPFNSYYPSSLIKELNLDTISPPYNYQYSNTFNKYLLGLKLDNFYKYNEVSDNLYNLAKTYGTNNYKSYDNQYLPIKEEKIINYLQDGLTLSYTSLNNYYNCAFKYYISNFLKLDPFEETFAMFIGKLFHYCLSKMYEENFDLDATYEEFLKNKVLSNKEKFFTTKLKKDLSFVIDTIRNYDTYSVLNNTLTEEKIYVSKEKRVKVTFMGIVDKIRFTNNNNGEVVMAIIDYKTGNIASSLDNISDGLNLQLPIYIYLATEKFSSKTPIFAGFYLEHIMPKVMVDEDDEEKTKRQNLRYLGYSNSNPAYLSILDNNYPSSSVIAGMSTIKSGAFSRYAKVLSNNDITSIKKIVENKIEEASNNILNGNFIINPKRIDDDLIGCNFCKYKDICFRKEEDILNLESKKITDILAKEGE